MEVYLHIFIQLGGTPSQMTGTRPPSCIHLDNRLYIFYVFLKKSRIANSSVFKWDVSLAYSPTFQCPHHSD